jgi:hypothetical protein
VPWRTGGRTGDPQALVFWAFAISAAIRAVAPLQGPVVAFPLRPMLAPQRSDSDHLESTESVPEAKPENREQGTEQEERR